MVTSPADSSRSGAPRGSGGSVRRVLYVTDFYIEDLLVGISEYAREAGWSLNAAMRFNGQFPSDTQADGVLATVTSERVRDWLARWRSGPIVRVHTTSFDLPHPAVETDYDAVGRASARHLLDLGHVHFAIYSIAPHRYLREMRGGFAGELASCGMQAHSLEYDRSEAGRESGPVSSEVRERWLSVELPKLPRPLAVMCDDDRRALEMLGACAVAGFRVPEDVAVLGCDNRAVEQAMSRVAFSSVDVDFKRIGWEAAVLLDRCMRGEAPPGERIKVLPRGVAARKSTATFVAKSPGITAAVLHLRSHFREPLRVAQLARLAGFSVRVFQEEFKRGTGFTVREELQRVRLAHVACLLRDTDLKLDAIAVESGFSSGKYMANSFFEAHGVRPGAWRREVMRGTGGEAGRGGEETAGPGAFGKTRRPGMAAE